MGRNSSSLGIETSTTGVLDKTVTVAARLLKGANTLNNSGHDAATLNKNRGNRVKNLANQVRDTQFGTQNRLLCAAGIKAHEPVCLHKRQQFRKLYWRRYIDGLPQCKAPLYQAGKNGNWSNQDVNYSKKCATTDQKCYLLAYRQQRRSRNTALGLNRRCRKSSTNLKWWRSNSTTGRKRSGTSTTSWRKIGKTGGRYKEWK